MPEMVCDVYFVQHYDLYEVKLNTRLDAGRCGVMLIRIRCRIRHILLSYMKAFVWLILFKGFCLIEFIAEMFMDMPNRIVKITDPPARLGDRSDT